MNAAEKELCKADRLKCVQAYDEALYAQVWARLKTPSDTSEVNNTRDALRHARWQAGLTKDVDESYAEAWGNAHELDQSQTNDGVCMDKHNNRIGREVGRDGGDIDAGVLQALNGGRLRLAPNGCP